ncbi:MAG: hypothetical protein R2713_21700 [Ilumatobacteraceae bacterium]
MADLDAAGAEVWRRRSAPNAGSALGLGVDVGTEAGNVELIDAAEAALGPVDLFFANAGVGIGQDLDTTEAICNGVRRQRARPPLGSQAPGARLGGARRGLLLLHGVGRRAAQPDRFGAVPSPNTLPSRSPSG